MLKMLLVFFTSLLLALSASMASAAEKTPIRIAFIDPLSGPFAIAGTVPLTQFKFDAARLNKAGGINGHPIEVVGFDGKADPQISVIQLQKAIDDGFQYITQGRSSAVGGALLNTINKHNQRNPNDRVLYFNYASLDPVLTNERCSFWHFRFFPNTDMVSNTLTDWLAKQKDIHKVFLINEDYSYGHAFAKGTLETLKKKRPDIKVVGNVFHPLGKVKDFSPYVTQIKASGAEAVITANYGQDIILLIKAVSSYGLNIPILTNSGSETGTISAIGDKGIDNVYLIAPFNGDYDAPGMAEREQKMYKETGYDYHAPFITNVLEMLKVAAEKADSIDPTQVAFALEGLHYDSPFGEMVMRAEDHQLLTPMYISVLKDHMKPGAEGSDINYHALDKIDAKATAMPTTCRMRRPAKQS